MREPVVIASVAGRPPWDWRRAVGLGLLAGMLWAGGLRGQELATDQLQLDGPRLSSNRLDAADREQAAAWAHYAQAQLLIDAGEDFETASDELAAAIRLRPHDREPLQAYTLLWLLDPLDLMERVHGDFAATAWENPTATTLVVLVAKAHELKLAPERARALLRRSGEATDWAAADVVTELAWMELRSGRYAAAHEALERATAGCGESWDYRSQAVAIYRAMLEHRAAELSRRQKRRYRQALLAHSLAAAALVEPGQQERHVLALAAWLQSHDQRQAARTALERFARQDQGTLDSLARLAAVHQLLGETDAAVSIWERLEIRYPEEPRFPLERARVLAAAGLHGRALHAYNDALRLAPRVDTVTEMAEIYLRVDRPDAALKLAAKIPEQHPAHHTLAGRAEMQAGDYTAALRALAAGEIAVFANTDADRRYSPADYLAMAEAALGAGHPAAAGQALQRGLQAHTGDRELALRLALYLVDVDWQPALAESLAREHARANEDDGAAWAVFAWVVQRRGQRWRACWIRRGLEPDSLPDSPVYRELAGRLWPTGRDDSPASSDKTAVP